MTYDGKCAFGKFWAEDKCLEFLKLVARAYCPPVSGHNNELPSDAEESTVDAGAAGSHSVVSEAAALIDVPTFNLGFILSLSDEEVEFNPDNSTADTIMWGKVTYFWFFTFSLLRK